MTGILTVGTTFPTFYSKFYLADCILLCFLLVDIHHLYPHFHLVHHQRNVIPLDHHLSVDHVVGQIFVATTAFLEEVALVH